MPIALRQATREKLFDEFAAESRAWRCVGQHQVKDAGARAVEAPLVPVIGGFEVAAPPGVFQLQRGTRSTHSIEVVEHRHSTWGVATRQRAGHSFACARPRAMIGNAAASKSTRGGDGVGHRRSRFIVDASEVIGIIHASAGNECKHGKSAKQVRMVKLLHSALLAEPQQPAEAYDNELIGRPTNGYCDNSPSEICAFVDGKSRCAVQLLRSGSENFACTAIEQRLRQALANRHCVSRWANFGVAQNLAAVGQATQPGNRQFTVGWRAT